MSSFIIRIEKVIVTTDAATIIAKVLCLSASMEQREIGDGANLGAGDELAAGPAGHQVGHILKARARGFFSKLAAVACFNSMPQIASNFIGGSISTRGRRRAWVTTPPKLACTHKESGTKCSRACWM